MNTITVEKKFGCGLKLFIHYNHTEYLRIDSGKSGECRHATWQVIGEMAKELKRDKLVEIFRGMRCDHGTAGSQSCFDFIARLLTPEAINEAIKEKK